MRKLVFRASFRGKSWSLFGGTLLEVPLNIQMKCLVCGWICKSGDSDEVSVGDTHVEISVQVGVQAT